MPPLLKKHDIIFVALAGVYVACAVIGGVLFFSPVPRYDTWANIKLLDIDTVYDFVRALFSFHNEHRIFYTRLLFLADTHLFGGSLHFLIVVNYLLVLAALFLFVHIYTRIGIKRSFIPFVLVSVLFFWGQHENMTWEFQSQFFLTSLMPLAAYYCFSRAASGGGDEARYFFLSVALGVLSTLTMVSGLAVLPMLTMGAAVLRMPVKRVAVLAALSIAVCAAFFLLGPSSWQGSGTALKDNPKALIHYTLVYLGNPFSVLGGATLRGVSIAAAAGAVFMVLTVFACIVALKKRSENTIYVCLALFILHVAGIAFVTGYGRVALGVEQAFSSRYVTPSVMAWSALMLIYLPYYGNKKWSWIPFAVLILAFLPYQTTALRKDSHRQAMFELSELSLMLGIRDIRQLETGVFPDGRVFEWSGAAKKHSWGFYNSDRMKALEKVFVSRPRVATSGVPGTGSFTAPEPVQNHPEYSFVTGAMDISGTVRSKEIYLLDGENRVIGVGLLRDHGQRENKSTGRVRYAFKAWLATRDVPVCSMAYHAPSGTWVAKNLPGG